MSYLSRCSGFTEIGSMLLLISISFLGFFWSILLISPRRDLNQASRVFGVLLLLLSFELLVSSGGASPLRPIMHWLYLVRHALVFAFGPTFFIYIRMLHGGAVGKQWWKHYLPALFFLLLVPIVFYSLETLQEINDIRTYQMASLVFLSLQMGHVLVYLFFTRKQVITLEGQLKEHFSEENLVRLKWLKRIFIFGGIFILYIMVMNTLIVTGGYYSINNTADGFYVIGLAILIVELSIKTWRYKAVIESDWVNTAKYSNSPLKSNESDQIIKALNQLMHEEHIYEQAELRLSDLALKLNTPVYILSQVINQEFGLNFFNYVNGIRIEKAKEKIQSEFLKSNTVEGLAYEVGFNSVSTFNRAFKRKTGNTPSAFARSL